MKYFHFTLGPVQGFVAQARRTRDFWAGSFLLSWLSGVAMAEIERQGGSIAFPIPADNYLAWITGKASSGTAPRQGGIPNRFKAFSAKVPADFDGDLVAKTIRDAWIKLADHIWNEDQLSDIEATSTRAIWQRQHQNFWEISWALTDDANASAILDQRKNWRSNYPQAEAGVKCMVMDGWQELSGADRPGLEERGSATLLKQFWEAVRDSGVTGIKTDLAEKEHLCALAYVKRRFVRHFESFAAQLDSGLSIKGWKLQPGIPSVSYMAAVHWLEKLVEVATPAELKKVLDEAKAVNSNRDEWETRIQCLVDAYRNQNDGGVRRELLALDGNLFFEHAQDNAKNYGYDIQKVADLQHTLSQIKHAHPELAAPPSPFYAVLLMDGDSLGVHMSNPANQNPISDALNRFTEAVPSIVEENNGFLIYAGGDDVLAILPLEDAMRCAASVRQCYLDCFKDYPNITTSISAAIQYAHVKMPLGKILGDAHGLLDDIAKDQAGRDALAVRVWKPGGLHLEWAQPWEIALDDVKGSDKKPKLVIETIADEFNREGAEFSSKFFHKIHERFDLLNPSKNKDGSYQEPILKEAQAASLLAVDFKNSGENRDMTMQEAVQKITPLLEQCRAITRDKEQKDQTKWAKSPLLQADGALLVRFLAQKGVE